MRNKQNAERRKRHIKSLGAAILLTLNFCFSTATAQTSINAAGGNASGSGGSAGYSVGQVFYFTQTGTNGNTVAQGVQQAYEISEVTGIKEAKGINLSVSAYPNPTADYLILEVKDFDISSLNIQLYDMQGKLLQNKKLTSMQTQIDMSNYVPSIYFVKVSRKNKEVKTFKIIKK